MFDVCLPGGHVLRNTTWDELVELSERCIGNKLSRDDIAQLKMEVLTSRPNIMARTEYNVLNAVA